MHSRSAAVYHFGFPVASRVSWGMRGGFFPVFVRTLVGTIWNGIQIIQGGYFTAVLLSCIIGKSFINMHNPIPASSDITIQQLIGVLIFFFGTLPLLSVPVTKINIIYAIKSAVLPPVVIGLFIFCMLKGKGQPAGTFSTKTLSGTALAWAMLSGINSTMGKTASNIVNQVKISPSHFKTKYTDNTTARSRSLRLNPHRTPLLPTPRPPHRQHPLRFPRHLRHLRHKIRLQPQNRHLEPLGPMSLPPLPLLLRRCTCRSCCRIARFPLQHHGVQSRRQRRAVGRRHLDVFPAMAEY